MKELAGRKLILILGIPFGIGCYLIGNPMFAVVTTIIMLGGLDEFYTICEKKGGHPNRIFGFIITLLIAVSYSGIYAHHQITIMGIICLSVISVFFIEIINKKRRTIAKYFYYLSRHSFCSVSAWYNYISQTDGPHL